MSGTETIEGIEVRVTRTPGAPLMMLVRMASPTAGVWQTVWDDLARHFTVASFDLQQIPSARAMDDLGAVLRDSARACADVASALDVERFHLFGWNGGTQVAMRCAVDWPDRVASLLLLDPFHELPDMRPVEMAVRFKQLLHANDRELYAYYWVMAGLTDAFIGSRFDEVERLARARIQSDSLLAQDTGRFMRWVRGLRRNWLGDDEFARIQAPTLILATEFDRWNAGPSIAMAKQVQARIRGAELQVIEQAGGHFLIEDPGRFLALAEPFLMRVASLGERSASAD